MANTITATNSPNAIPTTTIEQNSRLLDLPLELLIKILQDADLKARDVGVCSWVCRSMNAVIEQNFFWRNLFKLRFNSTTSENFKEAYKNQHIFRSNLANGLYSISPFGKDHELFISASLIHNGKLILGHSTGTIKVWDLKLKVCIGALTGHTDLVLCLIMQNEKLISGSRDGTIKTWDLQTLTQIDTEDHASMATSFTKVDGICITSWLNGKIKIFDSKTERAKSFTTGRSVTSLVTRDDKLIIGFNDGAIKIFDINIRTCCKTDEPTPVGSSWHSKEHTAVVSSLVIMGEILISASHDKTIKFWDIKTNSYIDSLENPDPILSLIIVDKKLISIDSKGTIKIYNPKTLTCCATIPPRRMETPPPHFGIAPLLFHEGKCILGYANEIEIFDFTVDDNTILNEVAELYENFNFAYRLSADRRFDRMPKAKRDKIHYELFMILKSSKLIQDDCWDMGLEMGLEPPYREFWKKATGSQRAQAIRNYLKKQLKKEAL